MSHDDFAFEPIPGLPAMLPEGERLLWQGSPEWRSLAIRAYHVRKVAVYFGVLAAWRIGFGLYNGHTTADIAVSCAFLIVLGSVAVGVLSLLAYFTARATVYSITSRRLLLRHGVAVPLTMNLPFKLIDDASVKTFKDRTGDIALQLKAQERIGYLINWPHLRPGKIMRPQPSLRALVNPEAAAAVLATALASDAGIEPLRTPSVESGVPDSERGRVLPRPRSAAVA